MNDDVMGRVQMMNVYLSESDRCLSEYIPRECEQSQSAKSLLLGNGPGLV